MKVKHVGYSMIELSVVIAIVGVLTIGVLIMFNSIVLRKNIDLVINDVIEAAQQVEKLYVKKVSYVGLDATVAANIGALSNFEFRRDNSRRVSEVRHRANGRVAIMSLTNTSDRLWGIYVAALPLGLCGELATTLGALGLASVYQTESTPDAWVSDYAKSPVLTDISFSDGKISYSKSGGALIRNIGELTNIEVVSGFCREAESSSQTFGVGVIFGR